MIPHPFPSIFPCRLSYTGLWGDWSLPKILSTRHEDTLNITGHHLTHTHTRLQHTYLDWGRNQWTQMKHPNHGNNIDASHIQGGDRNRNQSRRVSVQTCYLLNHHASQIIIITYYKYSSSFLINQGDNLTQSNSCLIVSLNSLRLKTCPDWISYRHIWDEYLS